jgi:MazG family protein
VTIVGLGPGDPESVPAAALTALGAATAVFASDLPNGLAAELPVTLRPLGDPADVPDGGAICAPDDRAHALARRLPSARTVPSRPRLRERAIATAVAGLVEVGAHLRRECPWDRAQTAETIVPHTVEEAFEVAEAIASGDSERQADEIGDLLFQAVFLAQLMEETGAADLGTIAADHARKLIARHPHVYGDEVAESAGGVRDLWERQKREGRGEGIFHEMRPGLPALAYATKAQKRAAAVGFAFTGGRDAIAQLREEVSELAQDPGARELGDVLFACVAVARSLMADPELALRDAAQRFRARVERAAELATGAGESFEGLGPKAQLTWYDAAKRDLAGEAPA